MQQRNLFHSFPRPKRDEVKAATLERGLSMLTSMKGVGLVLAPEIVEWDVSVISGGAEELRLLQRRACFTELSPEELARHSLVFGPIALSFDIGKLRAAGATPVIYVPQGIGGNPLSQIGTFCVRGAYHTRYVLQQLLGLKEMSDPAVVAARFGKPAAPNFELNLKNTNSAGNVVADYKIPASTVREVLQHVGFNNIPFDHSIGVLSVLLNMFYPTDNEHAGDELGYYRQREWRLIAGDINFGGRAMGRSLTEAETRTPQQTDPSFWNRELTVDGVPNKRSALALVYDPMPGWNFFELVEAIFAPSDAIDSVRAIVGDKLAVHPYL